MRPWGCLQGAVLACALHHPQAGGKSTHREIANPGQMHPGARAAAATGERASRAPSAGAGAARVSQARAG